MSRFVLVAGARPNFMKIAPILRRLAASPARPEYALVHTGQHYDAEMSDVFFEQLGIASPDARLQTAGGGQAAQVASIMTAFDTWLESQHTPTRAVVVVGDVNSTLAAALVAAKRQVPVVHVEAGLRSFDRTMPEELNRVVTDAVSDLLLVSEPAGMTNLEREGIPAQRIRYVGNVMIDTLVHELEAARELAVHTRWGLRAGAYAVVTLHRPSNVDAPDRLRALAALIEQVATRIPVIFSVHPRTRTRLDAFGIRIDAPGVHVCAPLGYRDFLSLVAASRMVLTDSGGIQEETTYLGIPCITLRASTERPVTTTRGTNVLVGDSSERARAAVLDVLEREPRASEPIPGWDGQAANRVVDALLELP